MEEDLERRVRESVERGWTRRTLSFLNRRAHVLLAHTARLARGASFLPDPSAPPTISALVRVRNEEETIEASLLSLEGAVDEIVVVDRSTDRTPHIVQNVSQRLHVPLLHLHDPTDPTGSSMSSGSTYASDSDRGLRLCSGRWILRWDGDFVGNDEGPRALRTIRRRLSLLDPRIPWVVEFPHVRVAGDLHYTLEGSPFHMEWQIVTRSPHLAYVDRGRFEVLYVPPTYARARWYTPLGFHLQDLKSDRRLFLRSCWTDWREKGDYVRYPTVESYALEVARTRYGVSSIEEATERYLEEYLQKLAPLPQGIDPFPKVLHPLLVDPPVRVVEEGGVRRRVGRLSGLKGKG